MTKGQRDLRAWMKALGLRQDDLAKMLRVRQPTVQRYLAGERRPRLPMAVALERLSGGAVRVDGWV